jgi:hypothetical protein
MRTKLLLALITIAIAGCGNSPSTDNDVDFSSSNVLIPGARVSVDLSRSSTEPSVPHTGHAIEVELTGANAHDTQALGPEPIALGGQVFSGPQDLRGDSRYRYGEVSYRYRRFFGQSQAFGIELLGGIARSQLDLTVTGASQSASQRFGDNGVTGSVGGIWRFRQTTSLQARFLVFLSDNSDAYRFDLQVAQALGRNASLRAGVAKWYVDVEADQVAGAMRSSNLGVRLWGPTLGLDLAF